MQKRQHEKCEIKGGSPEVTWWSDNGKTFNNNNSGEFRCQFSVGGGNTNSPELLLLKFCHYQTTTATSGPPPLISQLFLCCFFCMGRMFFLQFGFFLCRLH